MVLSVSDRDVTFTLKFIIVVTKVSQCHRQQMTVLNNISGQNVFLGFGGKRELQLPMRGHHHLHTYTSRVKVTVAASGEKMPDDPPESFKSEVRKRFFLFPVSWKEKGAEEMDRQKNNLPVWCRIKHPCCDNTCKDFKSLKYWVFAHFVTFGAQSLCNKHWAQFFCCNITVNIVLQSCWGITVLWNLNETNGTWTQRRNVSSGKKGAGSVPRPGNMCASLTELHNLVMK